MCLTSYGVVAGAGLGAGAGATGWVPPGIDPGPALVSVVKKSAVMFMESCGAPLGPGASVIWVTFDTRGRVSSR
jgi:hypothetical protein